MTRTAIIFLSFIFCVTPSIIMRPVSRETMLENAFYSIFEKPVDSMFLSSEEADINSEELEKIGKDDISTSDGLQSTQTIHAAGGFLESSDEIEKLEGELFLKNFLEKLFSRPYSLVGQADLNSEELEKIGKDDMSTSNGLQTTQKIPATGDSLESYDQIEKWEAEQLVENFWNKFLPGVLPCSDKQHDDDYPKSGSMFDLLNMNTNYYEDGKDME